MSTENARAEMVWKMVAKDKDGKEKWVDEGKNLIMDVGLDYMLNNDLAASTLYIGLTDGAPVTVASGDNMNDHTGWVEVTAYNEADRQAWGQGAGSGGVMTNATAVTFTASGTTTVGGGFLSTIATKGTATGTLFSAKAATEGDRALVAADTLDVTITLTVTSS